MRASSAGSCDDRGGVKPFSGTMHSTTMSIMLRLRCILRIYAVDAEMLDGEYGSSDERKLTIHISPVSYLAECHGHVATRGEHTREDEGYVLHTRRPKSPSSS